MLLTFDYRLSTPGLPSRPPRVLAAIDTQPVRSSSIVAELLQADSPPPGLLPALQDMCSSNTGHQAKPVTNVSAEAVAELMDLQLAMWLLRVCHVVRPAAAAFALRAWASEALLHLPESLKPCPHALGQRKDTALTVPLPLNRNRVVIRLQLHMY